MPFSWVKNPLFCEEILRMLEGTGFSPYIKPSKINWALAPEGPYIGLISASLSARPERLHG